MLPFHISFIKRVIRQGHRIILFIIALSLVQTEVSGQSYYFDQYSVKEGLAQSNVFDVLQDEEGYVWLGTESGISRFDGTHFINYHSEDGTAEKAVKVIFKDSNNNLWFGHKAGKITFYNGKKFIVHPVSDTIKNVDITSIIEDKKGNIWISTHGDGIFQLQKKQTDSIEANVLHFKGQEVGDRVFGATKFSNDSLYFITEAQIKKFNSADTSFVQYHPKGLTSYFQITSVLQDSEGDIWFGTFHGGLYRYKPQEDSMIIYDSGRDNLANNWISCITEDSNGDVWAGTWGGGITRFSNGKLTTFNNSNGLKDHKIRTITEDLEGNILIGTNDHGLLIFKGGRFLKYGEKEGLSNPHVYAIYEDKNHNLWFGTNKGISIYDPSTKEMEYFNEETDMIGDQIRSIKEDKKGNIWIGTNEDKVLQYLTDQKEFFYDPVLNNLIRRNQFTTLEVDNENNLWVGTIDGIIHYNIDNREIKRISQKDGLAANFITALYEDHDGRMWVGMENKGITTIKGEKFTQINTTGDIIPSAIIGDKAGNIWVGTSSKGVFRHQKDSLVPKYTMENGILSNHVTLLNVDKKNNLYIGTNKGLNKIALPEGNIHTYTKKSGFTGIETKNNATHIDHSGDLWFGTIKGVFKYRPEKDKEQIPKPITHIESMLVNMKETPLKQDRKFNYTDNSIIFRYNSICLSNPDAVRYKVKLEGAEQKWHPVSKQTRANYSSLSPGHYTFKVKARNHFGIWNEQPATYSFVIKPPFYQTWWFIVSVVILGIIGIIAFIKIRERNLKREKRVLEEKVAERTREISQKNKELEKKNNDIMDSIRYAQRIQDAVLPPSIPFENTFVLYRPKDIVSGDFYWLEKTDGQELIAAVDCTGHGVPGAFLSILGQNLLSKIVKEYGILKPNEILNNLNREVLNALHQHNVDGEKVVNDGMDLALLNYDTKSNTLQFAGAYNSLYLVRNGKLYEKKANRFPIGRTTSVEDKQFENHEIKVEPGDIAYIFSDGYADQFGGAHGKKFKSKYLKKFLEEIYSYPMDEQKKALEQNLDNWKGNYSQVDDIILIGRKF
jgi:ligand-binding sensor domain-containing protein/serine phosphatase RsbU (regulator of sigma subunit)